MVRLLALSLFVASVLGSFILVYIVPYYVFLSKKEDQVAKQFEAMITSDKKGGAGAGASEIVRETLDQMKALELYKPGQLDPSDYFTKIIESKNTNIGLKKLTFSPSGKSEIKFLVSGISLDRESLVDFIEALKIKGGFASVESPVSDFAKDKNISFTLNIIAKI